jgi:hypothetical protein
MIINTIIRGSKTGNIQLNSETPLFIFKSLGETLTIDFTYLNSNEEKGVAILYLNGEIIDISQELSDGSEVSFDITDQVTQTGFYNLRLVSVDSEENTDSVNYGLLFNFPNIGDFTFSFNTQLNGYNLVSYTGTDSNVNIPPIFNGEQGVLQVLRIAPSAFFNNDTVTEIKIPNTIASIGSNAFYGCSNLSRVEVGSANPPILESDNAFDPYNEFSVLKIYVPADSVQLYKEAQYWDEYQTDIFAL